MPRNIGEIVDDLRRARSKLHTLSDENARLDAIENRSKGENERLANVAAGVHRLSREIKDLDWESQAIQGNLDPDSYEAGDGAGPARPRTLPGSGRRGAGRADRGLAEVIRASEWDLRSRPSVRIAPRDFYNAWVFPATADFPSRVSPDVAGKIADRRYLWPFVPQADLEDSLSIQDFKQTVETVTGTIERDPASAAAKATYDGTVTSVTDAVKQVALVAPDIPAAVVNSLPAFNAWLETELSQQIGRAIDAHVVGQIVTAVPGITNVGTDPLFDAIRKAITAMRNAGANPSIVALNPAQGETLDLTRTADGVYLRGMAATNSGPLFDLTVIETPSVATLGASAGPLVIDPGLVGVLFTGPTAFEADPFTGFKNNLVSFRMELNLLFNTRNVAGARQIRN